ncbi:MAG: D-aminoacylase [Pseudomonadota bacterium]|nr:D-aminoacylase [Pseudomonadota bacterium]
MVRRPTRKHAAALLVASLTTLSFGCAKQPVSAPAATGDTAYDILIKGGRVIDGTGAPWAYADVGVRGGRIVAIGKLGGHEAKEVIDASNAVVTPGFIDMHTHSDLSLLRDGRGLSKIMQGVTTEVIGEGQSVAPRHKDDKDGRWGVQPDWSTLSEYFQRLEQSGTSINIVSYISAGQLRSYVMGEGAQRRATPEEMEQMKRLLAEGMEQGAAGLVQALETPGSSQFPPDGDLSLAQPSTDELIELGKVVGQYGGIYATHLRDQGPHIMEAVNEAATIGERAGIPVEIFHLKAAGWANFGKMPAALKAIHDARQRGVDIAADVYPYTAAAHGMTTELPRWTHEGGKEKMLARLADPTLRPRIGKEVAEYMNGKYQNEQTGERGFDAAIVSDVPNNPEKYVGKSLGQIARDQKKKPDESTLDLYLEQHGDVSIVMHYMSEKDMRLALQDPMLSIDSDGTAVSPEFGGQPHPRYYGTFPRVLGRYVREEKVISLEEAVRKMTSLAAQRMKLADRGVLREGLAADIVVFDPERIIDHATFDQPHQLAEGVSNVIVNGVTVVKDGAHTGAKPGRALRGPGYREPAAS